MGSITSIEPSVRREGRFEVYVEGKHAATVSLDIVERLRLRVGGAFEDVAEQVAAEAAALRTYDRALNMLAARARGRTELRRSLVRKGEEPAHVDVALERLAAAGLIDDAAFARQFARSRSAGTGASRRRIGQELARKGVARDVTDDAIAEVYEEEAIDEREVAVEAARKRVRSLASLAPDVRRRRLYAYLARRGYGPTDIRHAIEVVTGESASDDAGAEFEE